MPAGGINPTFPEFVCSDEVVERGLNDMAHTIQRLATVRRGSGLMIIQNGAGNFEIPVPDDGGFIFYNADANQVPAFGICLKNGSQANGTSVVHSIKRPDTYGCQTNWIINGPAAVNTGQFGFGQAMFGTSILPGLSGIIVAYDSADGTPAAGQRWGPRSGTYLLKKSTLGFVVEGIFDSTNHLVLVTPEPMWEFQCQPASDIAADVSGTVNIFYGGVTTSVTMNNVANNTSCTAKANKTATAQFMRDKEGTNPWQIISAHSS